jgi:hypothetical protein|tara:strand:+ start:375 stop:848 length:474 start_codon:yes stop_codon:yes gene_type:complete
MNVAVGIDEFDINSVFYQKPITNTVMEDANFVRVLYSNELITINGIFIKINLKINNVEAYYNKYKCIFKLGDNINSITNIKAIENDILKHFSNKKKQVNKISDQLNTEAIKIFTETTIKNIPYEFILKISGLWETATEYGITYKFTHINHLLQNTPI